MTKQGVAHGASHQYRVPIALIFSLALSLFYLVGLFQSDRTSAQTATDTPANNQISNEQACPTCPPESEQTIYAPLLDLDEAESSELNLNCRSSHPVDATPIFYTFDGTPITGEIIHLQPAEIRFVDTKSLLPAKYRNERLWGGMSLSYTGHYMEVWAQLTLHGINRGGSVNVLFSVIDGKNSNTQASVWWVPPGGNTILALGNSSAQSIHATLEFLDGDSQEVDIAPFATEVVKRKENQSGGHSTSTGATDSVIINSQGTPGSLIATGIISSSNGKFTASARFYDIHNGVQPSLFSTRFKMKNVVPHLLLRNTTTEVVSAQPRFNPAAGESGTSVELPFVTLEPNEAIEVDLEPLKTAVAGRADLREVSVQIVNNAKPGSLVGALYGTDQMTGAVYDIPLRDSGPLRISTGGYPIRIDGDYSTIVSITNVSDKKSEFTAYINYEGGRYIYAARRLEVGETAVFDVRKIRDEQIPDGKGQKLPESFKVGQFRWSIHGGGIGARLLGRAEVVSRSERVTSSYSCTGCCPSVFAGASVNPGSVIVLVDGFAPVGAEETDADCYGNSWSFAPGIEQWECHNTSIAAMDYYTGQHAVEGVAPGATYVWASWEYEQFIYDGQDCRDYGPGQAVANCDVDVRASVNNIQYQSGSNYVNISGTLYVLKGTSVTFKAVPNPSNATFTSGQPVWSGSSGASGTGVTTSVTFNTRSSSTSDFKTVTATAGNSVTVNIIVYELTNVLTPQDNFSGRSTTTFGVAEVINLSFTATPTLTATQAGGLLWKQTTGNGNLTGTTDGTGTYTAASSPESATLKLEIQAGPSKGLGPSSPITVIAPSGAYQVQSPGTNVAHLSGTCSAGFKAITYLTPKNVSFSFIEVREGATTASATGWLAPANGTPHSIGNWLPVANCTLSTGCKIQAIDTVYSQYTAFYGGPMWGNGIFDWNIPREWRVGTGSPTQYTTLLHHFVSDSTGKGTISKGGAGPFSKNAADPTSTY